jgi:hypothetical protein
MDLNYYPLKKNYGFLLDKAPQNVLKELKVQIDLLQVDFTKGNKYNDDLVGEIEHEYKISPLSQTKDYIKNLSEQFETKSQYLTTNYNPHPTLKFDTLWINFQKKYEYNPLHNHNGVYSFVIWYQIPYLIKEEQDMFQYRTNQDLQTHGQFHFVTPNEENNLFSYRLNIDKSTQGLVAIFPSDLHHIVYPFYSSDEYRITIAGNIEVA